MNEPDTSKLENRFWESRRVLVTGHTGFKGSWMTLNLLRRKAKVWGYALPPESDHTLFSQLNLEAEKGRPGFGEFRHCLGDINDDAPLSRCIAEAQPEVVFHLAAQPLVRRSYRDPLETWNTNVLGSLRLLQALKAIQHPCAVVMVTTDKVYENREWLYGYRESDRLGGKDPYSASKAAMELAVSSWRSSFCGDGGHQTPFLAVATARAGNVIGGGDWAEDRIIPDAVRALAAGTPIPVRNPRATRPWQHVLEPLSGYLLLAQRLREVQQEGGVGENPFARAFNFGPAPDANQPVRFLVESLLRHWPGSWQSHSDDREPHEAGLLQVSSEQARQMLGWHPRWSFETTVERTVGWYRQVHEGRPALACCLDDLGRFDGDRRY